MFSLRALQPLTTPDTSVTKYGPHLTEGRLSHIVEMSCLRITQEVSGRADIRAQTDVLSRRPHCFSYERQQVKGLYLIYVGV